MAALLQDPPTPAGGLQVAVQLPGQRGGAEVSVLASLFAYEWLHEFLGSVAVLKRGSCACVRVCVCARTQARVHGVTPPELF
eukprot:1159938-Pelagomonas_calceolata.AAC.13